MKKIIIALSSLMLITTSAFATRARMTALGQDASRGSDYIRDTRYVFSNPAALNTMSDYVVYEAENTEGGFFRDGGKFNYGVYLGSMIDHHAPIADFVTDVGSLANASVVGLNSPVDLFLAGDMGFSWGVRLHMAADEITDTSVKSESTARAVGVGMMMGDFSLYLNKSLSDERKAGALKSEGEHMIIGGTYRWRGYTIMLNKSSNESKYNSNKDESSSMNLGIAKIRQMSSSSRMFLDLTYATAEVTPAGGTKTETTSLPLTIGFEADANSWLTLRGSVRQSVLLDESKTGADKTTAVNNTSLNLGMTLNYGRLMVDGVLSVTGVGAVNAGELNFGDTIASNVSIHYWF